MFLYIDPGTGSMLFSFFLGLAAVGYFVFKAALIKIKFFFTGKKSVAKDQARKSFVIYNEGKQYWNVFLPVLKEFEARGIPVFYYTSAQDDPFFSLSWEHITGEYIGSGNKAYAFLNFIEADVVLMTTPGLDVYQLKRSRGVKHYAHILHAVDDATSYRLFNLDFFDSVLLSGSYQIAALRELEEKRNIRRKELPVVGCPYLDVLREKAETLAPAESGDEKTTVLISPSWGPSGLLHRFGAPLLSALLSSEYAYSARGGGMCNCASASPVAAFGG